MPSANEKPIYTESFIAAEDLSDYQYYGVTLTTTDFNVDLHDADTDIPSGILMNDPESGEEALVCVVGRVPIVAGETIAAHDLVRIDSNGKAMKFEVDVDTTAYCIGQCIKGADSGEKILAMVNAITPFRGEE